MEGPPLRTACFDEHVACGGNMVDFHGFELPIWYSSISEEHLATRSNAGLFDVSHMGFFRFSGEGLCQWLESISTQKVSNIPVGRCAYTHFLDEEGSIIDDMIFSVTDEQSVLNSGCGEWKNPSEIAILGVPNASMIQAMLNWFNKHLPGDGSITVEDLSEATSILALQGPASPEVLAEVLGSDNVVGRFKGQAIAANDKGFSGWIQGTGYTGERGFEIFIANEMAPLLWRLLLEKGSAHGLVPVGLGARDTLRLEKGYLLSGQDFLWPPLGEAEGGLPSDFLDRDTWQTNVPFGLDLEHQFVGRSRVVESGQNPESALWWGLKYLSKGPLPRPGKAVAKMGEEVPSPDDAEIIGWVTSGAPSPSLDNCGIAMAYLTGVDEGDEVAVVASPRKCIPAIVVRPPFI